MMLVDWKDLTVEKSSMLGVANGKYVKAHDSRHVPFMMCYGYDHNAIKLYLIECIENDYRLYVCKSEQEADETAFKIIVYLMRGGCVLDFIKKREA